MSWKDFKMKDLNNTINIILQGRQVGKSFVNIEAFKQIVKNESMTANEFKKKNHFRYTADRTCMNCKHMGTFSRDEYGSEGHVIHMSYKCFYDKENPKHAFQVYNDSICDKWDRNKS